MRLSEHSENRNWFWNSPRARASAVFLRSRFKTEPLCRATNEQATSQHRTASTATYDSRSAPSSTRWSIEWRSVAAAAEGKRRENFTLRTRRRELGPFRDETLSWVQVLLKKQGDLKSKAN